MRDAYLVRSVALVCGQGEGLHKHRNATPHASISMKTCIYLQFGDMINADM